MFTDKFSRVAIALLAGGALLSSCSDKKWTVDGTIAGAEGKQIIVEAPNGQGGWYPIDTVEVGKDGKYSVQGLPFGHPELLRLSLDNQKAYFPIDSIESVSLSADISNLQASTQLSGSPAAEKMQEVNDMIAKVVKQQGDAAAFDPDLKRQIAEVILRDPADIVAYYLIFHKVGQNPLYNPAERSDLRIIGAVANAYNNFRPGDPRTEMLKQLFLQNRKLTSKSPASTMVATELKFPDIALLDEKGKEQKLSDVAQKGNVVVLSFTGYTLPNSQALNVELNKVYSANKSAGLEIYQVGLDDDEFQWKQSAANLPWITVYNSPKDGDNVLRLYNVQTLPALFIINRNGDLVERVETPTRLASAVSRYL